MSAIIGVDPSSKKLAACITVDEQLLEMQTTPLPEDIEGACYEAFIWIRDVVGQYADSGRHPVFVFIEEPVIGRGGVYTTLRQAKVHGACVAGARMAGAFTNTVNNKRFKKVVIGNGNANKQMIVEWCSNAWPNAYTMAGKDQDLIDASAINRYGADVLKMRKRVLRKRGRIRRATT